MDDTYAINIAKSEYREGFNAGDAARVLSVFASEFTDMSDGRPTGYRSYAPARLRSHLEQTFESYQASLKVIINRIVVVGTTAYDYGWHELTLTPKAGGEAIHRRTRYLEVWSRLPDGQWRITLFLDNADLPDTDD